MDNLVQTIETKTVDTQEVGNLEDHLRNLRPHECDMHDLAQLYAVALIYEETGILDVIYRYMINIQNGWHLDELIILQSIYRCTCRKQNRELSNSQDGFVCQKFPPFSDLTPAQIELLKSPYISYLEQPYIHKYQIIPQKEIILPIEIDDHKKSSRGCHCILL